MSKRPLFGAFVALLTALVAPSAPAQFNTGTGPYNSVTATVRQSDGKILIGGGFTSVNGIPRNGIARLNADGTLDLNFNPGVGANYGSAVKCFAIAPDGKIYAGGNFIYVRQTDPTNPFAPTIFPGLIRLNPDGTVDDSFDPGIGFDGGNPAGTNPIIPAPLPIVNAIILQPDGNLIVGGGFANYNDQQVYGLTRLLPSGQKDPAFNTFFGVVNGIPAGGSGLGNPAPGPTRGAVKAMALLSNGQIIVGGDFNYWDLRGRRGIARINPNGSLDESFNPGLGATSQDPGTDDQGLGGIVNALAVQADGKIVVGGDFVSFNGVPRRNLARLLPNGDLDTAYNAGPLGIVGTNGGGISGLSLEPDGTAFIVGAFSSVNNVNRTGIAKISAAGTVVNSFNPGLGFLGGFARIIFRQPDGKLVVAGNFTTYNGTSIVAIARILPTALLDQGSSGNQNGQIVGQTDFSFDSSPGANAQVNAVALQADGKVILGGQFTSYDGTTIFRVARAGTNGNIDATFGVGTGPSGFVYAVAALSSGKVLVGGSFVSFNNVSRNGIAQLNSNGSVDTSFDTSSGPDGTVFAIQTQADGKILIGGNFTRFGSSSGRQGVARLNSNGSLDTSFNPGSGVVGYVNALAIQSDGRVVIGGSFSGFNGRQVANLARLNADGSLDDTFNVGTGTSDVVRAIVIQTDGKIVIGGNFSQVNGVTKNRIARLNTDGSVDATFSVGAGPDAVVRSLALERTGKIFVGGDYTTFTGFSQSFNPARLLSSGTVDTTFTPPTANELAPIVAALAVQSNDQLILGGVFSVNLLVPNPNDPLVPTTLKYSNLLRLQNTITSSQLVNVSSRSRVETGADVMIGGFVVRGDTPKKLLVRALGPSLTGFGVPGALSKPTLEVFNSQGTRIGINLGWTTDGRQEDIAATQLQPGSPDDAALLMILAPGAYTTKVSGTDGGMGVALVEVYDLDIAAAPRMINLSTRAKVQQGDNVLIGGFAVRAGPEEVRRVAIRAMGPSLATFGVSGALSRPTLEIVNSSNQVVATNTGWRSDTASATRLQTAGLAPTDDRECALHLELPAGTYTAIVRGVSGSVGVALVEIYEVN